ncbi:MAG: hypothetical protein U1F57_01515 [bacterium]
MRPEFTQMLKAFMTLEGVAGEDPTIGRFEVSRYLALPFMRAFAELMERQSTDSSSAPQ